MRDDIAGFHRVVLEEVKADPETEKEKDPSGNRGANCGYSTRTGISDSGLVHSHTSLSDSVFR